MVLVKKSVVLAPISFLVVSAFFTTSEFHRRFLSPVAFVQERQSNTTTPEQSLETDHVISPKPFNHPFALNDITIDWDETVDRIWLNPTAAKPTAQLLLTNFGWNQPNQTAALQYPRTIRLRKLLQGIINHPWFHPTAWQDIIEGRAEIDPTIRYYVFLDAETCFESNWPNYGKGDRANADIQENRIVGKRTKLPCYRMSTCSYIDRAVKHRLFQSANATVVAFECRGDGPPAMYRKQQTRDLPLALVTVSSQREQLMDPPDQGLPPPAGKPVHLTAKQKSDIKNCKEGARHFLMTFAGNFRDKTRKKLKKLHNGKDVLILKRPQLTEYINGTFEDMLASSKFGAAPRGDNKFSYRFTEVLSAGAIPVVHSDGWVLPFRPELVDWSECAVHIPEQNVSYTLEILAKIDDKQRCKMRQRCYEIYQKYMRTHEGTVAGVIAGLELVANKYS